MPNIEDVSYPQLVPTPSAPRMSQASTIEEQNCDWDTETEDEIDDFVENIPDAPQVQLDALQTSNVSINLIEREGSDDVRAAPALYRNMPELGIHFDRIQLDGRRTGNKCRYCKSIIKSHMTNRMVAHLMRICPLVPAGVKEAVTILKDDNEQPDQTEKGNMNSRFALIIVKNNLPLRLLSCPLFKSFVRDYCRGRNLASREIMSDHYLPRIARRFDKRFIQIVSDARDFTLSIEFDHWTDANNRSMLGVVASLPNNTKHLLTLEDVSLVGHSSSSIIPTLKRAIEKIPCSKINAFVSDSGSSCVLARQTLISDKALSHSLQHRCIAHWLNLIGTDICKKPGPSLVLAESAKLARFLSNDIRLLAKMREAGANRCAKAANTRWYTTVSMLESLLATRDIAINIIVSSEADAPEARRNDSTRSECIRTLTCDDFWPDVEALVQVLRPLINCIAVAESKDGTIGRTMKAVLDFSQKIMSSDWSDETNLAAVESFLTYFSEEKLGDEMGILLAAYFIDRHSKMDFVSEEGSILVFQAMSRVAKSTGFKGSQIKNQFVEEFHKFCGQQGSFGCPLKEGESSEQWWLRQPDTTVIRKIALRLANLKSSSANIERVFSALKHIQSPARLQFSMGTLVDIAKIKVGDFARGEDVSCFDPMEFLDWNKQTPRQPSLVRQAFSRLLTPRRSQTRSQPNDSDNHLDQPSPRNQPTRSRNARSQKHLLSTAKLLKNYELFTKVIDFNIVNSIEENTADNTLDESVNVVLDQAVKKLRMMRRRT